MDDSDEQGSTKSGDDQSPHLSNVKRLTSKQTPMVISSDDEKEPIPFAHKKKHDSSKTTMEEDEEGRPLDKRVASSSLVTLTTKEDNNMSIADEKSEMSMSMDKDVQKTDELVDLTEADEKEKSEEVQKKYRPSLPRVGCPEKIASIFMTWSSAEPEATPYKMSSGKYCASDMIKRVVGFFVNLKHILTYQKHEYAVVILKDAAYWYQGFTSNPQDIISILDNYNDGEMFTKFDLSSLFNVIENEVSVPILNSDVAIKPPPYVVRAVILYGRSFCIPEFLSGMDSFNNLMSSHYFFVDVLYLHEPPSETNKCEQIFSTLCKLDEKNNSYIFEVTRNAAKLHSCMAKLLAHPLQRAVQELAQYKLDATVGDK